MFYLLVFIGISLIAAGLYKEKGSFSFLAPKLVDKTIELNELNRLKMRIENIENILFLSDPIIDLPEDEPYDKVATTTTTTTTTTNTNTSESSLNTYKLIKQYEKENYTLEEICALLEMKKGEVILLKNLYKNYPL